MTCLTGTPPIIHLLSKIYTSTANQVETSEQVVDALKINTH